MTAQVDFCLFRNARNPHQKYTNPKCRVLVYGAFAALFALRSSNSVFLCQPRKLQFPHCASEALEQTLRLTVMFVKKLCSVGLLPVMAS